MKQIKNRSPTMELIEKNFNKPIEEILRIKYVEENKKVTAIAKEIGISYVTVIKWLKLAGIYSRKLKTITNKKERQNVQEAD